MLILGLLLIVAGALAIAGTILTVEISAAGVIQVLGFELAPLTLFLLGLGAGVGILIGVGLTRVGIKRSWRHRREHRHRPPADHPGADQPVTEGTAPPEATAPSEATATAPGDDLPETSPRPDAGPPH